MSRANALGIHVTGHELDGKWEINEPDPSRCEAKRLGRTIREPSQLRNMPAGIPHPITAEVLETDSKWDVAGGIQCE